MKKGIILELHRNYTILLTKDGAFEKGKVLAGNSQIGEEVFFETMESKRKSFIFAKDFRKHASPRFLSIACVLLLLILPYYFIVGADKTYAYVTVDINPSIELEIDQNYLVQNIRPMNKDASTLLEQLDNYQKEKLKIVIQMIMDKSEETGLINEDKSILVGVSFLRANNQEKEKMLSQLESHFQLSEPEWNIAAFNVPEEIREMALAEQTSMNELMAATFMGDVSVTDSSNNSTIDERKIEIIESFYTTDQNIIENESQELDAEESEGESEGTKEIEPEESIDEEDSNKEITNNQNIADEAEKQNAPVIMGKDTKEQKNNTSANDKANNSSKSESHPSELKSKNGEINSNGKNVDKGNNRFNNKEKNDNNSNEKKNGVKGNSNNGNLKKNHSHADNEKNENRKGKGNNNGRND